MQYDLKSFTVSALSTDTYRDNWERIFRPQKAEEIKPEEPTPEPPKSSEG